MTRYGHACLNTSKISSRCSVEEGEGEKEKVLEKKLLFFLVSRLFEKLRTIVFTIILRKCLDKKYNLFDGCLRSSVDSPCTYHPATPGSSPKHKIYALSFIVKFVLYLSCEKNEK